MDDFEKSMKLFEMNNPINQLKKEKSVDEIIKSDMDKRSNKKIDFTEYECSHCKSKIENRFNWFYLKHKSDNNKEMVLCDINCLNNMHISKNCEDYEIVEYTRCSAYFKCRDLNNLRKMCQKSTNRTYIDLSSISLINFCEPSEAGIIMATHKLSILMDEFTINSKEQFDSNMDLLTKNMKETGKQFKITTIMTILVIILTIISTLSGIAGLLMTYTNRDTEKELLAIKNNLSNLHNRTIQLENENKIDKKDAEYFKIMFNEISKELKNIED